MAQSQKSRGIEVFRPLGREVVASGARTAVVVDDEPRRSVLLGVGAALLAVMFAGVHAAAIVAAAAGEFDRATGLATLAIVGTVITALLGLVAAALGFGRRAGFLALVVSVLANPLVLTTLLSSLTVMTVSAAP